MRALVILALAAVCCAGQAPGPPLVNLGRLSIARVFASGRNGGQDAEGFYGVRSAFDGGSNILNGINYSTWAAGSLEDFVIVRFSRTVTVTGVVVQGSQASWMPAPAGFSVHIRSDGPPGLAISPSIALEGSQTVYAPPRPIERVREVMLFFQARMLFGVDEIEILGPAPACVDLSAVTPPRDPDLVKQTSEETDAKGPARTALIRTLAGKQIAEMRAARAAADRAQNAAGKAKAWMDLNRAADRLAELMLTDETLEPRAEEARALGVTVGWCEPGADWMARTEGYEKYLQLWPDGPQADEAWWMGRMSHGPRCGDGEGTPEEYEQEIKEFSDFLARFPSSLHAPEARQQLHDVQERYKASGQSPQR